MTPSPFCVSSGLSPLSDMVMRHVCLKRSMAILNRRARGPRKLGGGDKIRSRYFRDSLPIYALAHQVYNTYSIHYERPTSNERSSRRSTRTIRYNITRYLSYSKHMFNNTPNVARCNDTIQLDQCIYCLFNPIHRLVSSCPISAVSVSPV